MREIKFRAWDKEANEIVLVYGIIWHMGEITDINICGLGSGVSHERPIEQFEIMQFTGLKDKKGKEIYEGDILSNDEPEIDGKQTQFGRVVVKFGEYDNSEIDYGSKGLGWYVTGFNGYRRISGKKDSYEVEESLFYFSEWEVIGNIYENPELLK